jgi:hypothetical protein
VGRNGNVDEYNLQDSDDQAPYRHSIQVETRQDEYVISTIHVEKHERHFYSELGLAIDQSHWLHLRCLPLPLSQREQYFSLQEAKRSDDPKCWKPFQIQELSANLYQHDILSKGFSYTINFAIISATEMSLHLKIGIAPGNQLRIQTSINIHCQRTESVNVRCEN